MAATRNQPARFLSVAISVTLVLIALAGRPLHLLEHATPTAAVASAGCACVHHAPVVCHNLPVRSAEPKSPSSPDGDHDPDRCNVCLTFLLQSLPEAQVVAEQVIPLEVRRILPNDRLLAEVPWSTASARGPPCK
jgi:hypothetical protein